LSEKTEAPRDFEPVENLTEGLGMIREGAKTLASAMIWTKNQEHVINTHVSVFSDAGQCFYCWTPKGFDSRKFIDELKKLGEKECFFSISLLRANVFFKAQFLGVDHAGLQFKLPGKVFKVQRRKDLRLPIPDSFTIKVDFNDPLTPDTRTTKKVLDISASGLAFVIDADEVPMYPTGLVLKDLTFTVRNKTIKTGAEIRHSRALRPDGRHKGHAVGVLFKDIRPGESQHIAGFVFEESRKYFSRFI
jgi:hypothetical protein